MGGGGGGIVRDEIQRLRDSGVTIFSPEDGQRMGLVGMINSVVADCDHDARRARILERRRVRQVGDVHQREYLAISSCLYSLPVSVRGSCASNDIDRGHL